MKISGTQDFNRVDRLKASSDAVMVGIGTVLADDPSLTVKGEECRQRRINRGADEHPARIVVDSRARIPPRLPSCTRVPGSGSWLCQKMPILIKSQP